jgi:hypothetical protein
VYKKRYIKASTKEATVKTLVNKKFWLGVPVMVLVFGMAVLGCDNGTTGGDSGKTLIITDISAAQYALVDTNYYAIGIFPTGTTKTQAFAWAGLVAGADYWEITAYGSPPNLVNTVPLYSFPFGSGKRWNGSGTYDVFCILNGSGKGFVKRNVSITSEATYIDARYPDESF